VTNRDHTDRFPGHRDLDSWANGADVLAAVADRLTGVELEDLPGPRDLALRLRQRLALLARQQVTQLVDAGEDLGTGPVEDLEPREPRRL